jgi:hypothetical protein
MNLLKAVALSSMFVCTSAMADECDPSKILTADSYVRALHDRWTRDQTKTTDEKKKDYGEFKGNYMDVMKSDGTANFEKAYKEQFKLAETRDFAMAESYLGLSHEARMAYEKCLESKLQHVYLYPSERIMEDNSTHVTVRLEDFVDGRSFDATVDVDGGAHLTNGRSSGTFKIQPGGTHDIRLTRELDKPFTVHVTVGKETRSIAIPNQATTKLIRELRYSPNAQFGHPTNRFVDSKQLCIELKPDDDAILIPGSAQMATRVGRMDRGGQFRDSLVDEKNYSPKKVCRTGSAFDDGSDGVNITVCAYVVAEVVVQIPVKDSKSKYSDPKLYNADPENPCVPPAKK